MSDTRFRNLRDMPSTHLLGTGTPMCAGCGGLEALHEFYDVLGPRSVFVNAAGCMTLLAVYPFTPFRGSWLYTAMASAPAGAQGIRDALDILRQDGRIGDDEDMQVVVLTGDGGGTWVLSLRGEVSVTPGDGDADCVLELDANDFIELLEGRATAQQLFFSGKLRVEGDVGLAVRLRELIALLI